MRKINLSILMLALVMLMAQACAHDPVQPEPKGNMPITMDLSPALQMQINVSAVEVTITRGEFTSTLNMAISGSHASGLFTDLEPGIYAIDVRVFDQALLIATGIGTGTVAPGQSTTVSIGLQFVHGGLEIVVDWGDAWQDARRVLLVGNSHTYYNGGVDVHLQQMINEAHADWNVVVQARTAGGYTLENHYNDQATLNAISSGDWDLVILQEQSSRPMNDPQLFFQYCEALDSLITASGARTGFYMTWEWRNNPEMYVPIRDAYTYIGAYLGGMVAPAGVAFHNCMASDPAIDLYAPDNYHPSLAGTYLAACTMLASNWNIDPTGIAYCPETLDPTLAATLRQIARNTVSNWIDKATDGNAGNWVPSSPPPFFSHNPALSPARLYKPSKAM